jgi:predicted DsbA family dithiol-disulfide isomerase
MNVEIYGDVLCPWCYIGKRRVATALNQLADRDRDEVEVVWRSYELGQQNRTPGATAAEELAEMWGDRAAARLGHIRALGAGEGLELNLHLARPVSTFDAHRLIQLSAARGAADRMLERLLRAYHTEALDIADAQVLVRLGVEVGLAEPEVRELVSGEAYGANVREDEQRAVEYGVTSVPSVVIDERPPVSGVQPPAELRLLLENALALSRTRNAHRRHRPPEGIGRADATSASISRR